MVLAFGCGIVVLGLQSGPELDRLAATSAGW